MEKLLALEMVRVTEVAAIESARLMGRGDRHAAEREPGETFATWLTRAGGATSVADGLRHLDTVPTPDERPDFVRQDVSEQVLHDVKSSQSAESSQVVQP